MSELVLDGISKTFPGGVKAVDEISLTIRSGELMVLVGPSGCGKTTLLRMIGGLETVDQGSIRLGGRDITQPRGAGSRDRNGLSELRALPTHERPRQPQLRPARSQDAH